MSNVDDGALPADVDDGALPADELTEGSGSMPCIENNPVDIYVQARQRQKITQMEEKLVALESGCAAEERQTNYFVAKGRAIRLIVTLFDSLEDLVAENDRRYHVGEDEETTIDQDQLQVGYIMFTNTLRWFYKKATNMEYEEYAQMLKMLRQGADTARVDDTSKLKALVPDWVNCEFRPDPPVDPGDKHSRGFTNDACGRLLCPLKLDWNDPVVKAGIRDCADGYIVTDLSFPVFIYKKYTAKPDDLEEGLFKGKILLQAYKAVLTLPLSAKDVKGNGNGADIIQNNRCANKSFNALKVKKHVAQIIKMEKVSPRSITYIICQVRFALSSVTSWWSFDRDIDYVQFWLTIVDFFERPPSREARCRVDKLLEWWTRKVFGRSRRDDLSQTAKESMSVNALARQRAACDDAAFDSP